MPRTYLIAAWFCFAAVAAAAEIPPLPETSAEPVRPVRVDGGGSSGQIPYARVRVAIPAAMPSRADAPRPATVAEPYQPVTGPEIIVPEGGASQTENIAATEEMKGPEPVTLAVLGGKTITDLDVMREMWLKRGRETLDWMIGRDILVQEMARLGIDVMEPEVEARLQKHLDSLRKAFPNLSNPDDLTRAASGMRMDEYRERSVWVELALRKIMRVALRPTEEQLRAYFAESGGQFIQPERVRISQVFIPPQASPENDDMPGPADWALAEKQALEAHARLRAGEDFSAIARAYGSGGQLSRWAGRGELLRDLEESAFSLGAGSVSGIIRTAMGYHIITVEERRDRSEPKFEEVREQVLEQYEEKLFVLMAGEFMARLREKAEKSGGLVLLDAPKLFSEVP